MVQESMVHAKRERTMKREGRKGKASQGENWEWIFESKAALPHISKQNSELSETA
jgi:hypothetical protein